MEQIGIYKIHEYAALLPRMSDDEFIELKNSIQRNGLLNPILILSKDNPIVLDGINRLLACEQTKTEPSFITLSDYLVKTRNTRVNIDLTTEGIAKAEEQGDTDNIIREIIIANNITRRDLALYNRFELIGKIYNYPKHGGDRINQEIKSKEQETDSVSCSSFNSSDTPQPTTKIKIPLKELSKKIGTSGTTIKRMQNIELNASKEIKDKLRKNEISVNKAYDILKEEKKAVNHNAVISENATAQTQVIKGDWFDQNIEDESEAWIAREIVKLTQKIENRYGLMHLSTFRELASRVNHINYKELSWKQDQ